MKSFYLLFFFLFSKSKSEPIIKNINIPSCRNCIHYKPKIIDDFNGPFTKCENFGEKDIITNQITYRFADLCRNDESACGKEGKYFDEDKNIDMKILKHKIGKTLINPLTTVLLLYLVVILRYFVVN